MSSMLFCAMCRREIKPGEPSLHLGEDSSDPSRWYHEACLRAGQPLKFGSGKPVPVPEPVPAPKPTPGFADRRGRAEYLRQLKLKGEDK